MDQRARCARRPGLGVTLLLSTVAVTTSVLHPLPPWATHTALGLLPLITYLAVRRALRTPPPPAPTEPPTTPTTGRVINLGTGYRP